MKIQDKEYLLLESIYSKKLKLNQRKLAQSAGISLGMANIIIKKLLSKGWISIQKINNRTIIYALTPSGMKEIAKRSFTYLRRTIANINDYKKKIGELVDAICEKGYDGITLIGTSEVDFMIEYHCNKRGILFYTHENENKGKIYYIISETMNVWNNDLCLESYSYLSDLLLDKKRQ